MSSTTPRAQLPAEIWLQICSYLESFDVAALAQVSVKLNMNLQEEVYLAAMRDDNINIIVRSAATGNLATLQRIASHGANMNKIYPADAPQHLKDWFEWETRRGLEGVPSKEGVEVALSKACFATPLHLAAKGGHYDTVRWLLDQHSVDMEMPARFLCQCIPPGTSRTPASPVLSGQAVPAWTPLHIAICNQQVSVARLLLSRGASTRSVNVGHSSSKYPRFNRDFAAYWWGLDPTEYRGPGTVSALQSAALSGNRPIITELVQRMGTDVDEVVEEGGATPLYYALEAADAQSVALLRRLGASPEQSFVSNTLDISYDNAIEFALAGERVKPRPRFVEIYPAKTKSNTAIRLFSEPGMAWYSSPGGDGKVVSRLRRLLSKARSQHWRKDYYKPLAPGLDKIMLFILMHTMEQHEPRFGPLDQEMLDCFLIACQCSCPVLETSTLKTFLLQSKLNFKKVVDRRIGSRVIEYYDAESSVHSDVAVEEGRSRATTCTIGLLALHAIINAIDPWSFTRAYKEGNQALIHTVEWLIMEGASPTITSGMDLKWSSLRYFFDTITETWPRNCVVGAWHGADMAKEVVSIVKVLGEGGGWFPLGEEDNEAMLSTVQACYNALECVLPMAAYWKDIEVMRVRREIERCMPPRVLEAWKILGS
ncbi:hypothetical protein CSIM01_02388 [Colletotrichum simmondsii]|uniref:Ankyrin repeat protein n=1 Tax=Colletotrichum simmondsii TaxID=703756 RepID=A0A135SDS3_9PEZI|nr:hypothetical protein CSIM01_02388 [Colletotrichum simmondsii]